LASKEVRCVGIEANELNAICKDNTNIDKELL
jgi:hypothetical protein